MAASDVRKTMLYMLEKIRAVVYHKYSEWQNMLYKIEIKKYVDICISTCMLRICINVSGNLKLNFKTFKVHKKYRENIEKVSFQIFQK